MDDAQLVFRARPQAKLADLHTGDSNTAARSLGHAGDENSIVKSCRRQGRAH